MEEGRIIHRTAKVLSISIFMLKSCSPGFLSQLSIFVLEAPMETVVVMVFPEQ
jgi:hypothetical protein